MTRPGRSSWLLAVCSAVAAIACAAPTPASVAPSTNVEVRRSALSTDVTVTVLDSAGVPQTGTDVYAEDANGNIVDSAQVDASGNAVISLDTGTYQFAVPGLPNGFFFMSSACSVPSCTSVSMTVQKPVAVTVIDGWGNPVAGAQIDALDSNDNLDNLGNTDSQGHVTLSVDPETYHFQDVYGNADFDSAPCTVPGCTSATIQLQKPVQVTVTDGYGAARPDVPLTAIDTEGNEAAWATTDQLGLATMYIPSGAYFIRAIDGNTYFDSGPSGSCAIPGCTAASIAVTDVMVTVTDGAGNPLVGEGVTAFFSDGSQAAWSTTDSQGNADAFVPAGAYLFRVILNGNYYDSGPAGSCVVPGCRTASIVVQTTVDCSSQPDGTACNDGDACTQTDTCQAGVCVGSNPVVCSASDQCHSAGTCDPSSGTCSNPTLADGSACNDGNACTQTDTCQGGVCSGSNPVTCTAQDQCHIAGACDPSTGTCSNQNVANGTACNDGNACTTGETCQAGVCGGGGAVTCTADQCHTAGTCAPSTGCPPPVAKADGTACNDGNACTQTDTCQGGSCSGGNPVTCAPASQCQSAGTCNPSTGACSNVNVADGTPCNDGNSCTNGEICQGGTCGAGEPVVCVAQDECHSAGFCDAANGTCANQVSQPDGTPCSGGICMSAVCQQVSAASAVPTPLDPTVAVDIQQSTSFLYTGSNPIQIGVPDGTIARQRAAVLRGRVLDTAGNPILGATALVVGHPEYGATVSGADGAYSLAVNGGGQLRIEVQAAGYIPVQRTLAVRPLDYSNPPDVVMTQLDPASTVVNLTSPTVQIARATPVVDQRGSRQSVLAFFPGTQATAETSDGSSLPLNTLTMHSTELTVGASGPKAMPGPLPPSSGYTYAADLRADEASGGNVTGLKFSQPVVNYVDNFLNFPVGTAVPVGHYDMAAGSWVPDPDGCVIQVLGTSNGLAQIDSDGDGLPDSPDRLSILGITPQEQTSLASLYSQGSTLWRVSLTHFTVVDYNWPVPPPPGPPPAPPGGGGNDLAPPSQDNEPSPDPCQVSGSIVDCNNQILGERMPIVGTPFSLMYSSARVPGYGVGSATVTIPLTGSTPPSDLQRVDLYISVAGQLIYKFFSGAPNQTTTFTWNGLDAFGRPFLGNTSADIRLYYVYDTFYGYDGYLKAQTSFASYPNPNASGLAPVVPAEVLYSLATASSVKLANPNVAAQGGLGGWELDVHDMYDPTTFTLTQGNGQQIPALPITLTPFTSLPLAADDLLPAPDGSLYLSNEFQFAPSQPPRAIVRVDPTGTAKSVVMSAPNLGPDLLASTGDDLFFTSEFAAPGNPTGSPVGIVGKLDQSGVTTIVAGNQGSACTGQNSGDEGPATTACIGNILSMAVAPDGQVFIVSVPALIGGQQTQAAEIRRIDAAGVIHSALNPAVAAQMRPEGTAPEVVAIAIAPDYSTYLAAYAASGNVVIERLMNDGSLIQVAGQASGTEVCSDTDGSNGIRVGTCQGLSPTIGPDGALYLLSKITFQTALFPGTAIPRGSIVRLQPDGRLAEVFPGLKAVNVQAFKVAPNGDIIAAISTPLPKPPVASEYWFGTGGLYRLRPSLPPISEAGYVVPSQDGSEVYTFDTNGRHLKTSDGLTSATKFQFQYDSNGFVSSVTDRDGLVTTITRDGSGNPSAILSPAGQQTTLAVDDHGYLASITSPGGAQGQFQYSAGLLTNEIDSRGGLHQFTYDGNGRLIQDQNAIGGGWTLSRSQIGGASTVTLTSGAGRVSSYGDTYPLGSPGSPNSELQGNTQRAVTASNGLTAKSSVDSQGGRVLTTPDGTVTTRTMAPDPRFGMAAPFVSTQTVTTPGGLTYTKSASRSATVAADGVTLVSQTDTNTVNGQTTSLAYDGGSQRTTILSPAGRQSVVTLDNRGKPVSGQIGTLAPISYAYDSRGRVSSVTVGTGPGARVSRFTYDALDRVISSTDPLLLTSSFGYDGDNRLTLLTMPDGAQTASSYDPAGDMISLMPPGQPSHQLTYTAAGDEASYEPPAVAGVPSPMTTYIYNLDRQPTLMTRPDGKTVTFAYDGAGRLSTLTYDAGTVVRNYSPTTGQIANVVATDGGTVSLTFDGRLALSSTWSGTVAGTVSRTYNNNFSIATESVNGGASISFAYDADHLLTSAGALSITRDAANGLITGARMGGFADVRSYNTFGERTGYVASYGGTPLFQTQDTPDNDGRVAVRSQTIGSSAHTYNYGYDGAGRLVSVSMDGTAAAAYAYDQNGNRLSRTTASGTELGSVDAQDRLLTYGTFSYTYTPNGELATKTNSTTGQVTTYSYDSLGNLRQVVLPDGTNIAYVIDGLNRRIGKKVNGSLVRGWLYRDGLKPIAELDGTGAVRAQFVYGANANTPSFMVANGITYAFIADTNGSPRLIVDAGGGTVAEQIDVDDFGRPVDDSAPGFQPFGFSGGLYDSDTGLVRFGARDYDPFTGRWMSKDPILFRGGQANLYVYVGDDPINGADPKGTCHPEVELDPGLTINGCGPQGANAVCVPERPSDVNFGPACDHHDLGYATCQYPKEDTDFEFFELMLQACTGSLHPILCINAAELYFAFVNDFGYGAYNDSQAAACGAYPGGMCPSVPQSQMPGSNVPSGPDPNFTPDDYTPNFQPQ